jgi:DNA replication protein DnaC
LPVAEDFGCEYCHDAGFLQGALVDNGERKIARAEPCPHCYPRLGATGVPDGLAGLRFTDFDLTLNPSMVIALNFCREVAEGERWSALLMGNPGLGKSMLAVAALNERLGGCFWEAGALLRNIRRLAFDDRGPQMPEDFVLDIWQTYRELLVVDDLGAEKQTEWAAGTIYSILNARYQMQLPTIITTNNPDALDDRILSRYAKGAVVCEGRDVRRMEGA